MSAALKREPNPVLIPSILNRIFPAIASFQSNRLDEAIRENVRFTVKLLKTYSPVISNAADGITVQGAYYKLTTGVVTPVN